jgi:type II secretory pathway component PulF
MADGCRYHDCGGDRCGDRIVIRTSTRTERSIIAGLELFSRAGISTNDALLSIADDRSGPAGQAAAHLLESVRSGESVASALSRVSQRPNRPHLRVLMLAAHGAGEGSCFRLASELLERTIRLRRRLIAALPYPATMIVVVAGLLMAAGPQSLPGFDAGTVSTLLARTRTLFAAAAGLLVGAALVPRVLRLASGRLKTGRSGSPLNGAVARARETWICAAGARALVDSGTLPLDALRTAARIVRDETVVNSALQAVSQTESGVTAERRGGRRTPGGHRMLGACSAGAAPADAALAWEREAWTRYEEACDRVERAAEPVAVGIAGLMVLVLVIGFVRPLVEHYLEALAW